MVEEMVIVSKEGAKRSAGVPRFDLVPPEAIRYLAERFTLGAQKYGDTNWKQNMPIRVLFQHGIGHINRLMSMDFAEDTAKGHIGAILWMGAALAWYHEHDEEGFHEQLEAIIAKDRIKPDNGDSGAVEAGGKPVARTGGEVQRRVRRRRG